ncbi:PRA1 family protein 2 [Varanus komodoensis]|uniref:PRA1 family protein n=1 Tax=Varanus komodoensis TaxID=61221 RepID=A0A8D2JBH8_VARKO|nr:PRA1 family protein 2 isoform X1 [Varanus komodoensis]XP_044287071.1 PRA1 family protein 2 isoform X1 [Varanus komodoensis]KAF7243887.1 PRA1 family protein 2 [Varanus komodoensis]
MSEVRLPPVRPLDDFLLGSTRLAPPDLRDLQRWHNRVINNLLYYQSNYLLVLGAGLLLGGYFCPVLTLLSGALITLMFLGFVWAAENKAPVRRFRRNNPGTCVLAILAAAYFLVSLFEGSATFLFFIALPIMLILSHASLRLRNLKNKIENKIESIGLKRTPMGLLLEALGQEQEAGS